MILKKSVISVIFCIIWIDAAIGTSYSKVYVNGGSNVGPYQYIGYGAPNLVAYGPPVAQLSAPAGSVVPYARTASFATPCVSPCVPQQPVAQVANAGLVAYSAPIAVARDVPSNYEYSYVVYDDGTGDQKAARELSDGGVVRGQYSFLQPDGYVREVQYTADDVTGFNAVVNYLPGGGEKTVEVTEAKPCPEVKSEALTQSETSKEETPSESGEKAESSESEVKKSSEEPAASGEQASSEEKSSEASSGEAPAPEKPASGESAETATSGESTEPAASGETAEPASSAESAPEASASKEEGSKEGSSAEEPSKEETPTAEEPAKEEEAKLDSKEAEGSEETVPAVVTEEKPHEGETVEEHAEHAVVEAVAEPNVEPAIVTNSLPPGYVSYEQLLKCIQKMQNADLRVNSPLTYILLPSNAKPC